MKDSGIIPADKVRDVLVMKAAIKLLKPEYIVDRVVNFQFKDAAAYTKVENEVEISGFGKFLASPPKMRKKLKFMEKALIKTDEELATPELIPPERLKYLTARRAETEKAIQFLKGKLL
jgi:hypothetical protein